MITAAAVPDLGSVLFAFTVNLAAIIVFAVLMFFRRYTKPGLTVVFVFFNVGLFAVVTVIMRTEINAAVGFGLFAMLSIIRLRSDPFSPREIGYFFGALALGLINGLGPPDVFTLFLNLAVLGTMYVVDHPRLFVVPPSLDVTFDRVIADPAELRRRLEDRLGVHVREVTVQSIDYVRDIMDLKVQYLPTGRIKGGTASRGASQGQRPPGAGLGGLRHAAASRRPRTQHPPARPSAGFQVPPAARVAAPVAGSVANGPPSPVVPPPLTVGIDPGAVSPPSAPMPEPAAAAQPASATPPGMDIPPTASPVMAPAPPVDPAPSSPRDTPAHEAPPAAGEPVPRNPVFAPTAGPVFSPSAGPPTTGPPTTGPTPPVRAQGPVSPEAVPGPASDPRHSGGDDHPMDASEEPEAGQADTGRTWDKVLGRLNSWILS